MTSSKFRIAVRKYDQFETAIQKIWDKFCIETGCHLQLEAVPMDLHPLHKATLENSRLKIGEWY